VVGAAQPLPQALYDPQVTTTLAQAIVGNLPAATSANRVPSLLGALTEVKHSAVDENVGEKDLLQRVVRHTHDDTGQINVQQKDAPRASHMETKHPSNGSSDSHREKREGQLSQSDEAVMDHVKM
jgi:hypothetical protein